MITFSLHNYSNKVDYGMEFNGIYFAFLKKWNFVTGYVQFLIPVTPSPSVFWELFIVYSQCMFYVTFQVTLCSHYFCNFRKKGPRPKLTIYKHVSDNSKKCKSVGNFGILSVICRLSVCRASTAYNSLCRGLKYLLKVSYIILNYPNVTRFLIFETLCLGRAKTLTYV